MHQLMSFIMACLRAPTVGDVPSEHSAILAAAAEIARVVGERHAYPERSADEVRIGELDASRFAEVSSRVPVNTKCKSEY